MREFANPYARDAAFEQLLRLAAAYASQQGGGSHASIRKSPVAEDIERRAYQNYLGRGATDGHDLEDWLQAERELMEESSKKPRSRNKSELADLIVQ